ncbi:MAG: hypothetical protein K2N48_11425 [Muribaculaceae bacterium]|nr:hypothetical protein [Muribaculaceae bacterium]
MMKPKTLSHIKNMVGVLITVVAAAISAIPMSAQEFKVENFRYLPNDISAFINPVRDLNDEDCALLKVVAPTDFVFSTPLGIVKREDKTGEIWLYLPAGSRKITLKHAEWGVLRDYVFPSRLESHKTYEMTLNYPRVLPQELTYEPPSAVTIRDTLVVTRIDTLVVRPPRQKIPLEFDYTAAIGVGGKAPYTYCTLMAAFMKRHGGYLRVSFNGGTPESVEATCDRHGLVDGRERFYSGATRRNVYMVGGGAIHRLSGKIAIFEGLGYADNTLDWHLAPSEGGGYVRNSYFSHKGLTVEAGIHYRFKRVILTASVMTLKGTEWFGSVGIGIRIGKDDIRKILTWK